MTEGQGGDRGGKVDRFRQLHHAEGAFVMPNAWDAGSARILAGLGFPAIATTSAGYAFSTGRRDSFAALGRGEIVANAAAIAAGTDLPVSADLEDGFGAAPKACAETVIAAAAAGLAGGSIEDATGDPARPIYPFDLAVERIAAAAEAARGQGFVLTARCENFLWGRPDLADTIARLQAFSEAGAEVLFAPGLPDIGTIATLCREVDRPVSVVMGLSGPSYTVARLAEVGVKRVSVGGSLARAAYGEMIRAAEELRDHGSCLYAERAVPDREIAAMMSDRRPPDRS
ncbi:MAG: isocitrate lyase/phosphoenolpyruvate mutase family protein [Paracoccaceae bacterium]|nr:isocitrate lyase/phosphoenolpyruvate mutase family protein [Paracoccaceae bacterium]